MRSSALESLKRNWIFTIEKRKIFTRIEESKKQSKIETLGMILVSDLSFNSLYFNSCHVKDLLQPWKNALKTFLKERPKFFEKKEKYNVH